MRATTDWDSSAQGGVTPRSEDFSRWYLDVIREVRRCRLTIRSTPRVDKRLCFNSLIVSCFQYTEIQTSTCAPTARASSPTTAPRAARW